ncbi:MAG: hypothetical protein HND52_16215 [Ignavibacteriae bacterium]|nr:hypothetical protein [Ignavibacteriota bacterium]NOG99502.1 hypothetical protein [Ignavibacteriota bacterium]
MKHLLKIFLMLLVSTAIYLSCSDSSNPGMPLPFGDDFSYPLKVGNKWSYDREWSNFNFRPDSAGTDFPFTDTTLYTKAEVFVDREEILMDSIITSVVITKDIENSMNFTSSHFYQNTDDGLFILAYDRGGSSISYPKMISNFTDDILIGSLESFQRISSLHGILSSVNKIISDTLRYEDPPVQSFKYPFKQDQEWTYRNDYFIINKKVIGTEKVELPAGSFDCWKVQWIYDFANTGFNFGNITLYDYISSKGLIKRTLHIKDARISDINNPDGGGLVDSKEEIVLTGINF